MEYKGFIKTTGRTECMVILMVFVAYTSLSIRRYDLVLIVKNKFKT